MTGGQVMTVPVVLQLPGVATPSLTLSHAARGLKKALEKVNDKRITRYEHRLAHAVEEKLNAPPQAQEQSSKRQHDDPDDAESNRKNVRVSHTGQRESRYDEHQQPHGEATSAAPAQETQTSSDSSDAAGSPCRAVGAG